MSGNNSKYQGNGRSNENGNPVAALVHGSYEWLCALLRTKYSFQNFTVIPFHECYTANDYDNFNDICMGINNAPAYNTSGQQVLYFFYGKVLINGKIVTGGADENQITLYRHTNPKDLSSALKTELQLVRGQSIDDFNLNAPNFNVLTNKLNIQDVTDFSNMQITFDGCLIQCN